MRTQPTRPFLAIALGAAALLSPPLYAQSQRSDANLARAMRALTAQPVVDGHNDLPWRIREDSTHPMDVDGYDLRRKTPGHTDIARLRQGHVGAQFWSIYIPGERADAAYRPKGAVAS